MLNHPVAILLTESSVVLSQQASATTIGIPAWPGGEVWPGLSEALGQIELGRNPSLSVLLHHEQVQIKQFCWNMRPDTARVLIESTPDRFLVGSARRITAIVHRAGGRGGLIIFAVPVALSKSIEDACNAVGVANVSIAPYSLVCSRDLLHRRPEPATAVVATGADFMDVAQVDRRSILSLARVRPQIGNRTSDSCIPPATSLRGQRSGGGDSDTHLHLRTATRSEVWSTDGRIQRQHRNLRRAARRMFAAAAAVYLSAAAISLSRAHAVSAGGRNQSEPAGALATASLRLDSLASLRTWTQGIRTATFDRGRLLENLILLSDVLPDTVGIASIRADLPGSLRATGFHTNPVDLLRDLTSLAVFDSVEMELGREVLADSARQFRLVVYIPRN